MAEIAWLKLHGLNCMALLAIPIRFVQFMLKSFLVGLPKESRSMQMKSVTCHLKLGYLLATVLSRQMLQVRLNSEIVLLHGRCEEQ